MAVARIGHAAARLPDGRVLIVGGRSSADLPLASVELYDPVAGTFSAAPTMPFASEGPTTTVLLDGRVLVVGGWGVGGTLLNSAAIYNPTTAGWTLTGSMASGRAAHTATRLPNGQVLISGGWSDSAELYNPATGKFTPTGNLSTARAYHTATLLSYGRVLIAGGFFDTSERATDSAEVYDPDTGIFEGTGAMTAPRESHSATLLSNGLVLVAGGWTGSESLASAELYNPKAGVFSATGAMSTGRWSQTATALPDGRVLVAGGPGASADVYNAVSGSFTSSFTSAGSMTIPRLNHTATLLADGRVLLAGGDSDKVRTASAEIYSDPGWTGPWHGGTQIIITGSGLAGATVTVGDKPAAVDAGASTDEQLVVTVPSLDQPDSFPVNRDVVVIPSGALPIAVGTFTYRAVAVVLIRGLWTSLHNPGEAKATPKKDDTGDGFWGTGGLVRYLVDEGGWPEEVFLDYSYTGGAVYPPTGSTPSLWHPRSYSEIDSLRSLKAWPLGSVPLLDEMLQVYLTTHDKVDFYLVGHSQGGLIAMAEAAYLRSRSPARDPSNFTGAGSRNTGRIAGVVTLDSPVGGLATGSGVGAVQAFCRLLALARGLPSAPCDTAADVKEMGDIWATGWSFPAGGDRSIAKGLFGTSGTNNQQLAASIGAATPPTRTLTIGNRQDAAIAVGSLGEDLADALTTQWVSNGATGSNVFARVMNDAGALAEFVGDCGALDWTACKQIPAAVFATHDVVQRSEVVKAAIREFFSGRDPNGTGLSPALAGPGDPPAKGAHPAAQRAAPAGTAAATVAVTGTVTAAGTPIEGAWVLATSLDGPAAGATQTGAGGTYALDLPAGSYWITAVDMTGAHAPGYHAVSGYAAALSGASPVTVADAAIAGVDVDLPAGRVIAGTARDTGGMPAPDATVLVELPSGEMIALGSTAADGSWSAVVPAGSYRLHLVDAGGTWRSGYYAAGGMVTSLAAASPVVVGAADVTGVELVVSPVPPSASIRTLPTYATSTSVAVAWSGLPGARGVASHDVRYRRAAWNGSFGGYGTWKSATTATSGTFSAAKGYTYCFSARARDTEGLLSAWTAETCTAVPLDDRSLAASSGWSNRTGTAYYAGTYRLATRYGATLTRTGVVAKRIALVVTTCKGCGSVRVYWRGKLIKTVSLNSTTTVNRKLVAVASFGSAQSGTLVLKVSTSGRRVIVDGVAVRRN